MELSKGTCTYFVLFVNILSMLECKVGFPKDMSTNILFPPVIKPSSSIPTGHLRPLGFQTKASGKVKEILEMPDAHTFQMKYIKQNIPVVFREALKNLPVFKTWEKDDYLKDKFGSINITTTVKKQLQKQTNHVMQFKKFLYDYMYENWWLSTTIPQEIAEELPLPDCLRCGTYRQRLQSVDFLMSSGGTASLLHSHDDHNFHCVIFGRKDFIIIENKYKDSFDFVENYKNSNAGHSKLDMEMVNMYKYKDVAKVPWTYSTIQPGDCIAIPAGYMHQVRSYGRGISYSVLFAPSKTFDSSDCHLGDDNKGTQLSDAAFVWVVRDSKRQLSAMNMEPSILKKYLDMILRTDDVIHFEKFEHFFNEALQQYPDHPPAREAFDVLTETPGEQTVSRDQLKQLSPSKLTALSRIFNDAKIKQSNFVRDEL